MAATNAWVWPGPAAEHVSTFSLVADHNVSFSCTFDLDMVDVNLNKTIALPQVPLQGTWNLLVGRNGDVVSLTLNHSRLEAGALGTDLVSCLILEQYQDGAYVPVAQTVTRHPTVPFLDPYRQLLCGGFVLVAPTARLMAALPRSTYKFSVKLYRPELPPAAQPVEQRVVQVLELPAEKAAKKVAKQLAQVSPDLHTLAQPHDVRFFFPHVLGSGPFELWASERVLVASSTYFRDLLVSDDVETVPVKQKRSHLAHAQAPPKNLVKSFEDSDEETDALGEDSLDPLLFGPARAVPFTYKQITVKSDEASLTTYRAVLLWLQTGHIEYAPLLSSFGGADNPS
ncbi:hypothetical protein JCM9279_007714 [Rhodotorula babjevae]